MAFSTGAIILSAIGFAIFFEIIKRQKPDAESKSLNCVKWRDFKDFNLTFYLLLAIIFMTFGVSTVFQSMLMQY